MHTWYNSWLDSSERKNMISRKHAFLTYNQESDQWTIHDAKSTNGVFVNSTKVTTAILK